MKQSVGMTSACAQLASHEDYSLQLCLEKAAALGANLVTIADDNYCEIKSCQENDLMLQSAAATGRDIYVLASIGEWFYVRWPI